MRIEQLRYLIEIVDCGSFTLASERLFITQPCISKSINALEQELNTSLFVRSRKGVLPTAKCLAIVAHARKIIDEIGEIESLTGHNPIRIMASPFAVSSFLPDAIESLRRMDEGFGSNVVVTDGATKKAEELLYQGKLDFAIVPYVDIEKDDRNFKFEPMLKAKICAIVNKENPLARKKKVTFEELQKCPLSLVNDEFISSAYVLDRIRRYGKPNVVLQTPNPASVSRNMSNKNVVTLISTSCVDVFHYPDDEYIVLDIEETVVLTFGILSLQKAIMTPQATQLIAEIKNCVQQKKCKN